MLNDGNVCYACACVSRHACESLHASCSSCFSCSCVSRHASYPPPRKNAHGRGARVLLFGADGGANPPIA